MFRPSKLLPINIIRSTYDICIVPTGRIINSWHIRCDYRVDEKYRNKIKNYKNNDTLLTFYRKISCLFDELPYKQEYNCEGESLIIPTFKIEHSLKNYISNSESLQNLFKNELKFNNFIEFEIDVDLKLVPLHSLNLFDYNGLPLFLTNEYLTIKHQKFNFD